MTPRQTMFHELIYGTLTALAIVFAVTAIALLLSSCIWGPPVDTQLKNEAAQDDTYCQAQGFPYLSDIYMDCRQRRQALHTLYP